MAFAARFTRAASKSTLPTSAFKTATRQSKSILARQTFQQSRRGYSSEPSKSSSTPLLIGAGAVVFAAGAGYWLYTSNGLSASDSKGPFEPTYKDYQKVYNEIAERLEEKDDYDDGSYGPVLVRLAWHASGTYDKATNTGGSNGATMRFAPESDHGANAGLAAARAFMEPIKGT